MKESIESDKIVCGLCEEVVSSVRETECLEGKYETAAAANTPMIYVFCDRRNDGFFVVANSWSTLEPEFRAVLMREFCMVHCRTFPAEPAAVKLSEYGNFFYHKEERLF